MAVCRRPHSHLASVHPGLSAVVACIWRVKTSWLSLCCVFSDFSILFCFLVPSIAFCRYLNPWFKRDYNVAKWVEDVNKNTEGPYFRYFTNSFSLPFTPSQHIHVL